MDEVKETVDEAVGADVGEAWETVNQLVSGFFALIPKIVIAVILFSVICLIGMVARRVLIRIWSHRRNRNLGVAIGRMANVAIIFIALLVAVAVVAPSVGAKDLLQIMGVGSVAIGFAFRDILQNFLAGILILVRGTFKEGNVIEFGNYYGTVREISTRSTWISTFDGRDVAIPNGELFKSPITVVTAGPMLRSEYDFGVGYDADVDDAIKVILNAIDTVGLVLDDPAPDAGIVDLASSSVNIRARWWTRNEDIYNGKTQVLRAVKYALERADIDIPFPHQVLLRKDQDDSNNNERQAA